MCSLTLITREHGYLVGMNRDERVARGTGLAPVTHVTGQTRAAYPTDGVEGTWIGTNDRGITLALLNWHDVTIQAKKERSRGLVIPAILGAGSLVELNQKITDLDLQGLLPFRLVGIFPVEQTVAEWRWDSTQKQVLHHSWEHRLWCSSSLSDEHAEDLRRRAAAHAAGEADTQSAMWIRRLHASHTAGPYSFCVHRGDVETLSYSEVECSLEVVRMTYLGGNPCRPHSVRRLELPRNSTSISVAS